ncbi:hypothetical protein RHMOL_Rhmol09G0047700 [Rhododendron molle]|uniref:Uncharacterized protein n=1 Tax=Rhododendron molle TaxID=49168 RepID=A0ACC0M9P7_RHOML|nr:hypothetical protein RHMOL_Rhmol09G0047700 [Rhododendron molle]
MIRAAQCVQNVILRILARNQQKKKTGKGFIRAVFVYFLLNGSNKNCSNQILPGHFFCRFFVGTLKITF